MVTAELDKALGLRLGQEDPILRTFVALNDEILAHYCDKSGK